MVAHLVADGVDFGGHGLPDLKLEVARRIRTDACVSQGLVHAWRVSIGTGHFRFHVGAPCRKARSLTPVGD